jgi:hypothetical protein
VQALCIDQNISYDHSIISLGTVHPSHQEEDIPHHLYKVDTPHHLRMVVMPLTLHMVEVHQVDMEEMYLLLDIGMRLLVGMELGHRGMIIGDRRLAVRPPLSATREA